jgi:hypothetical protein
MLVEPHNRALQFGLLHSNPLQVSSGGLRLTQRHQQTLMNDNILFHANKRLNQFFTRHVVDVHHRLLLRCSQRKKQRKKKLFFTPKERSRERKNVFLCSLERSACKGKKNVPKIARRSFADPEVFKTFQKKIFFFFARMKYLHAFHVHIYKAMFIQCLSVAPPRRRRPTLAHATTANLRCAQTVSDRAVLLHTPLVIDVLHRVQRAFVQQFFSTTNSPSKRAFRRARARRIGSAVDVARRL